MKKSVDNVYDIMKGLSDAGGIVRVGDDLLMLLSKLSRRTIHRRIEKLIEQGKVYRKSIRCNYLGNVITKRVLVITEINEARRGFSMKEQENLAKAENHKIVGYENQNGSYTYEWWRKPNDKWEVTFEHKEWRNPEHIQEFIYDARAKHQHIANTGDYLNKYVTPGKNNPNCFCKACKETRN